MKHGVATCIRWGVFFALASSSLRAEEGAGLQEETRGVLGEGTEWETPWFATDSGIDGPVVLITGGIHGNEPAGAHAADQIRHWPLKKGKLIVVPRVNRKALEARVRRTPGIPEELGDINRVFPRSGETNKAKTKLAAALWQFAGEIRPDWVIDLHEGRAVHRQDSKSVGSSILCLADDETRPLFEHALEAVNASVDDPANRFVLLAKSKMANGSLARAARERLGAKSAILETTYNGFPLALRIRQHRLMVNRLLRDIGVVDVDPDDLAFAEAGKQIRVAIYEGGGVGGAGPAALRNLLESEPGRFLFRTLGSAEVKNGGLDPFDVVIFPGGSGSKQAGAIGEKGREEVRGFVRNGGGYIGICAGCYLACENFSWSLKILDAKTKSSKWKRGSKELELEFDRERMGLLGMGEASAPVKYSNGPVMAPADSPEIPDFTTWATFLTEVSANGTPEGIQIGSPAILVGEFGTGRVVGVSPHPEQTPDLDKIVLRMVEWSARREDRMEP